VEVDSDAEVGSDDEEEVYVNAMHYKALQGTSQLVMERQTRRNITTATTPHGGISGPSSSVDALCAVLAKIVGLCTSVQLGLAGWSDF
jgi:hypothetical protein